jgi:hypothetical protein
MKEVAELVSEIYASGARLVVLGGGLALEGEISDALKEMVSAHKEELLEALVGDPLEGLGWEARTALHRRALRWLDGEVEKLGPKYPTRARAAVDAMCRQDVADPLEAALCGGDFGEFRAALRKYAKVGLRAARGKDRVGKTKRAG